MSKERLRVIQTKGIYRVQWMVWLNGYYQPGAILGEDEEYVEKHCMDAENKLVHHVIGNFGPFHDSIGWYWNSKSEALKMVRIARAALKSPSDVRPFPDWAKTAIKAGWKPPKDWKP